MLVDSLRLLLALLAILSASFLAGSWFRPLIRVGNVVLQGVFFFAFGFAVLSCGVVLLDAVHLLRPLAVWAVLLAILTLRIRTLKDLWSWVCALWKSWSAPGSFCRAVLQIGFAVSVAVGLLAALSPEIGGDALTYHLNVPKVFLRAGTLAPNPFDLNSYFPLFTYNLYLVGLATSGACAAKAFTFFFGFLLVISLKEVLWEETKNLTLSMFAALAVWVTPTVYNQLGTAYVDVSMTFFSWLALVAFVAGIREKKAGPFFASGLLIGAAIGTKYIAVICAASLGAVWLLNVLNERRAVFQKIHWLALWAMGFALTGGFWLCRNWALAGNPVFPYFGKFFGTAVIPGMRFEFYGIGKNVWHFVSLFWDMFFQPRAFGGFTDRIGVFYFLWWPFLFFAALFVPRARKYLLFLFCFLVMWFKVVQVDRYMMPVLPVVALAGSMGVAYAFSRLGSLTKFAAKWTAVCFLTVYVLSGLYHYRYVLLIYSGIWPPEIYLTKMERTPPLAAWINRNLPKGALILTEAESRQFYIDRPLIRDIFLKYRTHYDQKSWELAALAEFLKSKNITHLLIRDLIRDGKGMTVKIKPADTLLGKLAASGQLTELYAGSSENIRDEQYAYRLYAFK